MKKFLADILLLFFFLSIIICFSEKISLDSSCESSAKQMINMKCQDYYLKK